MFYKFGCWLAAATYAGLISKNTTLSGDKGISKDPLDTTINPLNKPLAPIGGGSPITRVNAGQWLLLFHGVHRKAWHGTRCPGIKHDPLRSADALIS